MAQRVKVTGRDIEFIDDAGRIRAKMGLDGSDQLEATTYATNGNVNLKKIIADPDGPALTSANVSLSAQWGTGASVSVTTGATTEFGDLQVTAGTTSSAAGTITITFPEGAHARSPRGLVVRKGGSATATNMGVSWTTTTTTLVITFLHAPGDGNTVVVAWMMQRR